MNTLAIDYLPLTQLTPYARNSRTHSPEQLTALANSIRAFGFNNPVLVDAEGTIVAGHGRVQAAALAGLDTVPCIRLTHLTEAQRRAYVIADNRLGELSGWDMALLASEVEDLLTDGDLALELTDIGFEPDAFGALPELEPERPRKPTANHETTTEDPGDPPTGDDLRDIGQGATTPGEGKGLRYPVILQLDKPTYTRWRKAKGQRTDSEAIAELLLLRDTIAAETAPTGEGSA